MSLSRTSTTLLEGLRDPQDHAAWLRFDSRFRPMLRAFGLQLGLGEHDAEDAGQRTLTAFYEAYQRGDYDRRRGRLKHWLRGIARRQIAAVHTERARRRQGVGDRAGNAEHLRRLQDPESLSQVWEQQWRRHLLAECLRRARARFSPRDLRVFVMLGLEGRPATDVARALRLSPEAVRQIKYRVLAFLRSIQADLESAV